MASNKWNDCQAVYPPPQEIALAPQDKGKKDTVKKKGGEVDRWKFPALEKLARKIYNAIQKEFKNPEGLTKNVTRGCQVLCQELVILRKSLDISEAHPFFHEFGCKGKVYLITNNPANSGVDVAISKFQEAVTAAVQQKNSARTSNDGLRVGCILLDPKCRESVVSLNLYSLIAFLMLLMWRVLQLRSITSIFQRKKRDHGTPIAAVSLRMNAQEHG